MSPALKRAYLAALDAAARAQARGDWDGAFAQLERAHVLGQRYAVAHVRSHLGMLRLGWARRDRREWRGQLGRIVAAALVSRIWVPAGNTGGAGVSPLQPMPVAPDLQRLLDADRRRA